MLAVFLVKISFILTIIFLCVCRSQARAVFTHLNKSRCHLNCGLSVGLQKPVLCGSPDPPTDGVILGTSSHHTHTQPFNSPLSGTTRVSRYQKGKTNLDFTEAWHIEWQWHQLGHMQVCTALQTDNLASTPPLKFFYRPDALPATQPTASKALKAHLPTNCEI